MKKTLFTLAALAMAAVASAATDGMPVLNVSNPSGEMLSGFSNYNDYSLTTVVVVDWNQAVARLGDIADFMPQANSDTAMHKSDIQLSYNGFGVSASLNGISLYKGENGNLYVTLQVENTDMALTSITVEGVTSPVYTLELDPTTYMNQGKLAVAYSYTTDADAIVSTFSVAALKADGTMGTSYDVTSDTFGAAPFDTLTVSGSANGVVERITVYEGALTGTTLAHAAQSSVPEPATATLSLLALAGLAARRRRK